MLHISLQIDGVSFQLQHSFILGLDFLTAIHAYIDYDYCVSNRYKLRLMKNYTIHCHPKRSEMTISVLISRCKNGHKVL